MNDKYIIFKIEGIEDQRQNAEEKIRDLEVGESDSKILNNMFRRKVDKNPARGEVFFIDIFSK